MTENFAGITNDNKGAFSDEKWIPASDVIPNALILTQSTQGPVLEGDSPQTRIPFVDEDPNSDVVVEGKAIKTSTPSLTELRVSTHKIGLLTPISYEASRADGVTQMLSDSMRRAVTNKADSLFLSNATEPYGLASTPGILAGGAITDTLDPIIDAIGQLGENGAMPSAIILGYGAWSRLLKLKDAESRPVISPDVANAPTPLLFGLPVILNKNAAAGTLLIVDKTQVLSSVSQLRVATSDQFYFDEDKVAMRVLMRVGFGVLHPNRIAKLTITEKAGTATD